MQRFLKNQQEIVLVVCAIALLGSIIAFFSWGIGAIVANVDRAISVDRDGRADIEFNIDAARKVLESRGITP